MLNYCYDSVMPVLQWCTRYLWQVFTMFIIILLNKLLSLLLLLLLLLDERMRGLVVVYFVILFWLLLFVMYFCDIVEWMYSNIWFIIYRTTTPLYELLSFINVLFSSSRLFNFFYFNWFPTSSSTSASASILFIYSASLIYYTIYYNLVIFYVILLM